MIYNYDYECRKRFTAFADKYFEIPLEVLDGKGALKPRKVKRCINQLVKYNLFTLDEIRAYVKLPEEYYKL